MICSLCKKEFELENFKTCNSCRDYNKNMRDKVIRNYKQGEFSSTNGIDKKCSDCLHIKKLSEFYKHKRYKDGYRNQCINCHSNRWKTYYNNCYNEILKEKVKTDIIYKIKQNQKSYIHLQLKNSKLIKTTKISKYIGCTIEQLKQWLEFQFEKDMNWDNKNWQIDHIIPVSLFNLHDDLERQMAFNWTNIQPLYKDENLKKYNKIRPYEYFNSIININRFIKKYKLHKQEYKNIQNSLQWFKSKYFATLSNCGKLLKL